MSNLPNAAEPKTETRAIEDLSEAERMSRIRDLLVGPVIADEQARHEQSVSRLDQDLAAQAQTIAALTARISELEQSHRLEAERSNLRLLGMMEALLADERDLRARLVKCDPLRSKLDLLGSQGGKAENTL